MLANFLKTVSVCNDEQPLPIVSVFSCLCCQIWCCDTMAPDQGTEETFMEEKSSKSKQSSFSRRGNSEIGSKRKDLMQGAQLLCRNIVRPSGLKSTIERSGQSQVSNRGEIQMNQVHGQKQHRAMTLNQTAKQKNKGKLIIEESKEKHDRRGNNQRNQIIVNQDDKKALDKRRQQQDASHTFQLHCQLSVEEYKFYSANSMVNKSQHLVLDRHPVEPQPVNEQINNSLQADLRIGF